jgi:hypothetical protein
MQDLVQQSCLILPLSGLALYLDQSRPAATRTETDFGRAAALAMPNCLCRTGYVTVPV